MDSYVSKGISTKWNANSSSRIWTWAADSISNGHKRYAEWASCSLQYNLIKVAILTCFASKLLSVSLFIFVLITFPFFFFFFLPLFSLLFFSFSFLFSLLFLFFLFSLFFFLSLSFLFTFFFLFSFLKMRRSQVKKKDVTHVLVSDNNVRIRYSGKNNHLGIPNG